MEKWMIERLHKLFTDIGTICETIETILFL